MLTTRFTVSGGAIPACGFYASRANGRTNARAYSPLLAVFYILAINGNRKTGQTSPPVFHRSIAVLPFKNLSQDPENAWLSTAFSEWLAAELPAAGDLSITASEKVAFMATDLSLAPDDIYPPATLSRIRKNLSADVLVLGSFAVAGEKGNQQVRVDVRIVNAATGETLAHRSETAGGARLLDFVSSLGSQLREDLRLSQLSPAQQTEVRGWFPRIHLAPSSTLGLSKGCTALTRKEPLI